MVGEIRDLETAEIAIKAAQTGHLVLSTLHTNDAPQTLTRLVDMGVEALRHRDLGQPDHCATPGAAPVQRVQAADGYSRGGAAQGGLHRRRTSRAACAYSRPRAAASARMATRDGSASIRSCPSPTPSRASSWQAAAPSRSPTRRPRKAFWDLRRSGLEKVKGGPDQSRGNQQRHHRMT